MKGMKVAEATNKGHGGMDFFVVHALVESIKAGKNTPLDVYDAATWSVISPLSEKSIENNGSSVEFPDFSKGKWKTRKDIFAFDDSY